MNTFTKLIAQAPWFIQIKIWLDHHLVLKQWLWFGALWLSGLLTALALCYPLKLLIKLAV